jgi:hypothetical protein
MDLREIGCEDGMLMELAYDLLQWWSLGSIIREIVSSVLL